MYLPAQAILSWLLLHHQVIDYLTRAIAVCSVLHTVLPPWDWNPDFVKNGLSEFPTAQSTFRKTFNNRWYRVLIFVIGYIALNARSTVWHFISVHNLEGPNANVSKDIDAH